MTIEVHVHTNPYGKYDVIAHYPGGTTVTLARDMLREETAEARAAELQITLNTPDEEEPEMTLDQLMRESPIDNAIIQALHNAGTAIEDIEDIYYDISEDDDVILAALELDIDPEAIDEAYVGQYTSDADFAQEYAQEIANDAELLDWPYTCIDWDSAASDLMMDYSSEGGYYFRDL